MNAGDLRRVFAGRAVLAVFVLLVGPLAAGALDGRLMTPLALPGYLLLSLGSAVGSLVFTNFAPWVFWIPFVVGSYAVAVVVGAGYRAVRRRR